MEAKTARREGASDIIGGIVEFTKFGIKTYYNAKYVEELKYAGASILALHNAESLVRSALSSDGFPSQLRSSSVLTDITNYLVDFSEPDGDFHYNNVIKTWGQLLFNNQQAIKDKKYNFSPLSTKLKQNILTGPSDIKISLGILQETSGNADVELNRAYKLISNKTIERPGQIKKAN